LLGSSTLRRELSGGAHVRLLAEHTYQHRARQLVQVVHGPSRAPVAAS
jgi:hypothetical protein